MNLPPLFRLAVRWALGLREPSGNTPGDPEELWRLGLYRARVDKCATDGSAVDVTPEDPRLSPMQSIPLRSPFPGAVTVVSAGAIVLVGWERGEQTRPYALPLWESGSATKVTIPATTVYLGEESGAQFVALANLVKSQLDAIASAYNTHTHTVSGAATGAPSATYTSSGVAASKTKAK